MSQNTAVVNFTVSHNSLDQINAIKINGGGEGRPWVGYTLVKTSLYAIKDLSIGRYKMVEPGFFLTSDARIGEGVGYVSPDYKGNKVEAPNKEWMPVDRLEDQFFVGTWGNLENPEKVEIKNNASRKLSLMNLIMSGEGITLIIKSNMRDVVKDQLDKIDVGGAEAIEMTNTSIRSKVVSDKVWNKAKSINVEAIAEVVVPVKDGESVDLMAYTEPRLIPIATKNGSPMKPKWWMPNKANSVAWWASFEGQITSL
jgi:hypothetical protein